MLVPIRCFTCGGLVGDKYEEFANNKDGDESPSKVLDDLGLKRYFWFVLPVVFKKSSKSIVSRVPLAICSIYLSAWNIYPCLYPF